MPFLSPSLKSEFRRHRPSPMVRGGRVVQEAITLGILVAFLSYIRMFFPAHPGPFGKIQYPAIGDGLPRKNLFIAR